MKPQSGDLTAEQSLDIITTMIRQAKGNAKKNSFYFLLWGWVITLANLGMFTMSQLGYPRPYLVWFITIPAWLISVYRGFRQNREDRVHTHLDSISIWLWCSFALCVFTVIAFGSKIHYQINPVILLISTIPTIVSGTILRFRPLLVGGVMFWIMGIISFLVPPVFQSLVGACAIITGYLIPGYMLHYKKDE